MQGPIPPEALRWRREDIDFAAIDREALDGDEAIFYLVAAASFVEYAADLYTTNLVEYYRADADLSAWLRDRWQWQELQHGASLRSYVEAAWPDFDWPAAYADFYAEYAALCKVENFKPGHAEELAARCIVETGTASLYRMLRDATREPVLKALAQRIYSDEVHHYKTFYRHERRYCTDGHVPRRRIALALLRRGIETRQEDSFIALKHIWRHCHPHRTFRDAELRPIYRKVRALARRHWPYPLTANMVLAPLDLPDAVQPLSRRIAEGALRLALFV